MFGAWPRWYLERRVTDRVGVTVYSRGILVVDEVAEVVSWLGPAPMP